MTLFFYDYLIKYMTYFEWSFYDKINLKNSFIVIQSVLYLVFIDFDCSLTFHLSKITKQVICNYLIYFLYFAYPSSQLQLIYFALCKKIFSSYSLHFSYNEYWFTFRACLNKKLTYLLNLPSWEETFVDFDHLILLRISY